MEKKYTNLKDIEKDLSDAKLFRFNKSYNPKTIKEVVIKACIGTPTYYADNNKIQCFSDRRRGISDIYRIAKYYFKDVSLQNIIDIISKDININETYCYTTNQTVCKKLHPGYKGEKKNVRYIRLKNWRKNVRIES